MEKEKKHKEEGIYSLRPCYPYPMFIVVFNSGILEVGPCPGIFNSLGGTGGCSLVGNCYFHH